MTKDYSTEALFALPNLTNLRVLHVEHLTKYPVHLLADNAALTNLERLYFHPHQPEYGDDDAVGYLPIEQLHELAGSPIWASSRICTRTAPAPATKAFAFSSSRAVGRSLAGTARLAISREIDGFSFFTTHAISRCLPIALPE